MAKGLFHVHSENSLNDCALRIPDICKKAANLGYEAVVLTDFCSMTGIAEFVSKAVSYGLKPIPGVELLVSDQEKISSIILFAKNYDGYIGLCKILSMANLHLIDGTPVALIEELKALFGPLSRFHGSVFASSSDVNSILCQEAVSGFKKIALIQDYKEQLHNLNQNIKDIDKLYIELSNLKAEQKVLNSKKRKIETRTKKNFFKKEEQLTKITDKNLYNQAWTDLQKEKQDCLLAEKELSRIQGKIARQKKKCQKIEKTISVAEDTLSRISELQTSIQKLENQTSKDSYPNVYKKALFYKEIFGDCFFIELMFHGKEEEFIAMPLLLQAAEELSIKTIISNDVHILNPTKNEILRCQIMRSLKDNVWHEPDSYLADHYMKSEEELRFSLEGFLPDNVIESSFCNMHKIADECSFSFPCTKHYPKYQDPLCRKPEEILELKARENIKSLLRTEWNEHYEQRFLKELKVIQDTGYSDYTLILSEILQEGRTRKKDGMDGYYIGPGRGSGAGSLVNYLMGITHIDPIKYDLIFERYLNIERVSPPDIDSDIATSIRDSLVRYITDKYSKDKELVGVCSIITKSRLTAKAAIRAAGRIVSSKYFGNAAKLYMVSDKISKAIPTDARSLTDCETELLELFQSDTETEILVFAKLIEGIMSGYGTHAAGMIISDNGDITEYAPVMNMGTNESPIWNIQYDKDESEAIGLLKLDALGLTTLDVISNTMHRIQRTTGKKIDIDHIPFEKQVFKEIYAKGNTIGVFQCESAGMKKLWMQLRPDCIEDIIAGVALYRPGPLDFIPEYIKGKHNPQNIRYLTPRLKPILQNTYGTIVYQEQVMRIVRDLAGYSMGRSDLVRRAMSKKKEDIMNKERHNFIFGNSDEGITGCINNGITESVANKIYDQMIDFAKYAFNKSHAAAYAIVSYQSAYLKYHYPKEFLIEAMNQEKPENIPIFIEECKKYGYEVLLPDINNSQEYFTEYDGKIIYGLGNVKGVKNNAAVIIKNRNGIYSSFTDYLLNSGANKIATIALIKSGAFSTFCPSRKGLLELFDKMEKTLVRIKTLEKRISEKKQKIHEVTKKVALERLKKSLESDIQELDKAIRRLHEQEMPSQVKETAFDKIEMEKETLFTYISVHPTDDFQDILKDTFSISSMGEDGSFNTAGVIQNVHTNLTKKNQRMATFELEDRTGRLKAVCFPKQFEDYKDLLKNGTVLRVCGTIRPERDAADQYFLQVNYISVPVKKQNQLFFMVEDEDDWEFSLKPKLIPYRSPYGSRVLLYKKDTGLIEPLDFFVNEEIKNSKLSFSYARKYLPNISL